LGEAVIVAGGIVAEEPKMESILAGSGSVAASGVATRAEEDGLDVQAKAGRSCGCGGGWSAGRILGSGSERRQSGEKKRGESHWRVASAV
jgi:hypothetical protein